jgi:hypothetical protein
MVPEEASTIAVDQRVSNPMRHRARGPRPSVVVVFSRIVVMGPALRGNSIAGFHRPW